MLEIAWMPAMVLFSGAYPAFSMAASSMWLAYQSPRICALLPGAAPPDLANCSRIVCTCFWTRVASSLNMLTCDRSSGMTVRSIQAPLA